MMPVLLLLILCFPSVLLGKENMFAPPPVVVKKPRMERVILHTNNPLQKFRLDAYRITGVVVAEGFKKAIVVAPDRKTYLVKVGDYLGNRGERIVDIEPDRIVLVLKGKRIEIRISKKKGEGGI